MTPVAAASADKPTWTVPADWQEGQLAQFLVAKFIIGSGDATAAVNVSSLAGDGGGLLPNVNRWRDSSASRRSRTMTRRSCRRWSVPAVKATLVDFTGTDARTGKPARLVGVVLPLNGQTWFYKLMGDPDVVAQQKDAFIEIRPVRQISRCPLKKSSSFSFRSSSRSCCWRLRSFLVFVGTLAQADEGLYGAQAHYFKQWLVVGANFFGHKIPLLLPGGYLIGTLLLVNLVAAHIYRFEFTRKKTGIQLAHAGVIVLLVGQLSTDLLAREMQMHFAEGETRNYSDSATDYELIFQCPATKSRPFRNDLLKPGSESKD